MSAAPGSAAAQVDDVTPSTCVERYIRLPRDVRRELGRWLEAEGLIGEYLTWFRLLEGAIEAERWATDADGALVAQGDEIARERRVYLIMTAPPKAALS